MAKGGGRERIVAELLRRPEGIALSPLAEALGITAPTLLRQLDTLVREGSIKKRPGPEPRSQLYFANDFIEMFAIDAGSGTLATFHANGPFSWRFPLVSRLPDPAARFILLRLLAEADKRGSLYPWLRPSTIYDNDGRDRIDVAAPDRMELDRRLKELARIPGTDRERRFLADPGETWVVFGSAARGDAGASSDVDLLILVPHQESAAREVASDLDDLVADANLGAPKRIDAHIVPRDKFPDLPARFRSTIRREGVTIYASFEESVPIEAWRAP